MTCSRIIGGCAASRGRVSGGACSWSARGRVARRVLRARRRDTSGAIGRASSAATSAHAVRALVATPVVEPRRDADARRGTGCGRRVLGPRVRSVVPADQQPPRRRGPPARLSRSNRPHAARLLRGGARADPRQPAGHRDRRHRQPAAGRAAHRRHRLATAGRGRSAAATSTSSGSACCMGRPLLEADAAAGAPPLIVISERLWRRRFARDPSVLGTDIRLNGRAFTIVGVTAGTSTSSLLGGSVDAWITLAHADAMLDRSWRTNPDNRWWTTLVRADAAAAAEVDAALERATAALATRLPDPWRDRKADHGPGHRAGGQPARRRRHAVAGPDGVCRPDPGGGSRECRRPVPRGQRPRIAGAPPSSSPSARGGSASCGAT